MTSDTGVGWLLDDLVARVPAIREALVLTRDGLTVGLSATLTEADGDRLAAIAAGFHSLARGAVRHLGAEQVRQVIVEMDTAFLFITAVGEGSCLAVVSSLGAEVGLIAYEMAVLIRRVGEHLAVRPRIAPNGSERM